MENVSVSTFAGTTIRGLENSLRETSMWNGPVDICASPHSNEIYVVDQGNQKVRRIDLLNNVVLSFSGSVKGIEDSDSPLMKYNGPFGLCFDSMTQDIIVCDSTNNRLVRVSPNSEGECFVGGGKPGFEDGVGTDSKWSAPFRICVDEDTGDFYVSDFMNNSIRKVSSSGVVETIAGTGKKGFSDGFGTKAQFHGPRGICFDRNTSCLFVCDFGNNRIRKIDTSTLEVTTVGGNGEKGHVDGRWETSQFLSPYGICINKFTGELYICDSGNHSIRVLSTSGDIFTLAGSTEGVSGIENGGGDIAKFNSPRGICIDDEGNNLFVCDFSNHCIRQISLLKRKEDVGSSGLTKLFQLAYNDTEFFDDSFETADFETIKFHKFIFESRIQNIDKDKFEFFMMNQAQIIVKYLYTDELDIMDLNFNELIDFFTYCTTTFGLEHLNYLVIKEIYSRTNEENIFALLSSLYKIKAWKYCKFPLQIFKQHWLEKKVESFSLMKIHNWAKTVDDSEWVPIAPVTSHLDNDIRVFLEQRFHPDVSLSVKDVFGEVKQFNCHKFILAQKSEFFDALFRYEKGSNVEHITPLRIASFEILLDFWYGDVKVALPEDVILILVWGGVYLSEQSQLIKEHYLRLFQTHVASNDTCEHLLKFIMTYFDLKMIIQTMECDFVIESKKFFPKIEQVYEKKLHITQNITQNVVVKRLQEDVDMMKYDISEMKSNLEVLSNEVQLLRVELGGLSTTMRDSISKLTSSIIT